jgi:DNA mismatch repair protein MutS
MKLFATDTQTLSDLNITGKNNGITVFNLFNRTATTGGAAILESMFGKPLSDSEAINKRAGIFKEFSAAALNFPFKLESVFAAERYLNITDERTTLSRQEDSLGNRLTNLLAEDNTTKTIKAGINALIEIITDLHRYVDQIAQHSISNYYSDRMAIVNLLTDRALLYVVNDGEKGKISSGRMADLDLIFRFRQKELILKMLNHIYLIDVYITVASVAANRNFTYPIALTKEPLALSITGLFHPELKKPVKNNIAMQADSNLLFLTGANMAGKSTFMKSLGIAVFLAHIGFPVPASAMKFSVLDGMYTTINLSDNLEMGASHFYAEVLRVKKIAKELGNAKHLFVLFDELFRGTNVKDAHEATIALTQAFAKKRNSIFVISTHIIEAGDTLKQLNNIRFKYLPTTMNGNEPVYTYTLLEGITADRHGMIIINNEGILDILNKEK